MIIKQYKKTRSIFLNGFFVSYWGLLFLIPNQPRSIYKLAVICYNWRKAMTIMMRQYTPILFFLQLNLH